MGPPSPTFVILDALLTCKVYFDPLVTRPPPIMQLYYWYSRNSWNACFFARAKFSTDKVRMYDEEIMTNNDNLESNLLTSSLLKKTSDLHAGTS